MSNSWMTGRGSTWQRVRLAVLERDGWICQICMQPIPRDLLPSQRFEPLAAQVHHTGSRALVGDDPKHLVAAHRKCNLAAGDPSVGDPDAKIGHWW